MSDSVYQYDCPGCGNERPTMTKRARENFGTPDEYPEGHPWDDKQLFHCEECDARWTV